MSFYCALILYIQEAKKAYQEGIILARLLGDTSLADIISEKMRDAMKE